MRPPLLVRGRTLAWLGVGLDPCVRNNQISQALNIFAAWLLCHTWRLWPSAQLTWHRDKDGVHLGSSLHSLCPGVEPKP